MRSRAPALLLWALLLVLALLAWTAVTGRLGRSRHGYGAVPAERVAG